MFKKEDNLFMIDIETDGLSPSVNHITSICVQKFTMDKGIIGAPIHVAIDTAFGGISRYADLKTLQWREEHKTDNGESKLTAVSFLEFYEMFSMLTQSHGIKTCHFFANHPEFDIAYIKSYTEQAFRKICWHYQNIWDLESLIKGLGVNRKWNREAMKLSAFWGKLLDDNFNGKEQPHNAHYDCVYQIELLRHAYHSQYCNN